jgi:type IV secretion system protein VirB9
VRRFAIVVAVITLAFKEQQMRAQTASDDAVHLRQGKSNLPETAPYGSVNVRRDDVVSRYATREVRYHSSDIVELHARIRFTTLIELPQSERIMEATTGDKDFWVIDVMNNICFIHPSREGSSTNLNLITDKGNIYSFVISDVTEAGGMPDLRVLITTSDASNFVKPLGAAQYVPAAQLDQAKQQLETAQSRAGKAVEEYRSTYPLKLKFDYQFKRGKAPFEIWAIYHDDKFTYIKSSAMEKFALYDVRDGKPTFTYYELRDGTYVVPTVLDQGYVEIGKARLTFKRKE